MLVVVAGADRRCPPCSRPAAAPRTSASPAPTPTELPRAIQAQGDAVGITARVHRYDSVAAGEEAVRDGDVDVLVVDAQRLEWRRQADEQLRAVVTGAIQLVAVRERAAAAGISPDDLLALVAPVPVENVELGAVAGRSPDDETAAFVMTVVLFLAITTYGSLVLTGVVEEKSSRVVEVLLARMPARNLLAGKVAGIGLLGLAQIAVTALVALVAVSWPSTPSTSRPSEAPCSPGSSCGSCSATPCTPWCTARSARSRRGPRTPERRRTGDRRAASPPTSSPSPPSGSPDSRLGQAGLLLPGDRAASPCPTASPWARPPGGSRSSPSSSPSPPSPAWSCSAAGCTPAPSSTPAPPSSSVCVAPLAHPGPPRPKPALISPVDRCGARSRGGAGQQAGRVEERGTG